MTKKDTSIIPVGIRCYNHLEPKEGGRRIEVVGACPYWSIRGDKPEQENGYCSYLEKGDWEFSETSHLWDMCKECGINIDKQNTGLKKKL